jgi:FkbM family methyltransferase
MEYSVLRIWLAHAIKTRVHVFRVLGIANKTAWKLALSSLSRYRDLIVVMDNVCFTVLTPEYGIFKEIFIEGEYTSCLECSEGVAPDFIVDLGGNVGFGTLYFKKYWPSVPTIVFEPIPSIFARLKQNMSDVLAVKIHNQAAGCVDAKRIFVVDGASSSSENLNGSTQNTYIECDQIDIFNFISELKYSSNGLLKIDIEGEEWNLMNDSRFYPSLTRFNTVILEIHEFDVRKIIDFEQYYAPKLVACGFTIAKIREVPQFAAVYVCWRA